MTNETTVKVRTQLEVCESELDSMTDWEKGFIESISEQFFDNGYLSKPQQDTLQRIYDKVV